MVQCVFFVRVFVCNFGVLLLDELFGVFDVLIWLWMYDLLLEIYVVELMIVLFVMYDVEEVFYFVDCVLLLCMFGGDDEFLIVCMVVVLGVCLWDCVDCGFVDLCVDFLEGFGVDIYYCIIEEF